MIVLGIEDVHHEHVVRQDGHHLLGLSPVVLLYHALNVHAALVAVGKTFWRWWALDGALLRCKDVAGRRNVDRDFFFFGGDTHLTAQRQRVGDLAPVLAACADAGVLRVELDAGVWALDAAQLLVHALGWVRVHLAEPCSRLVGVIALLGQRQQPAPDRLHPVLCRILNVVGQLPAAVALLSSQPDRLELGCGVLEQLYACGGWGGQ